MDQNSQPPEVVRLFGSLEIPASYPVLVHVQINDIARECFAARAIPEDIQTEFQAALQSLVYRFKSCIEAGESFSQSVTRYGAAPTQPERYHQERDFFYFTMSGVSCFETLFYALFAWGAALNPGKFPFQTDKQRRNVTLENTIKAYQNLAGGDPVMDAMNRLKGAQNYTQWITVRKVLFHRGLPGRLLFGSTGPETQQGQYKAFADLEGVEIHPDTISEMINGLTNAISNILRLTLAMMQSQRGMGNQGAPIS